MRVTEVFLLSLSIAALDIILYLTSHFDASPFFVFLFLFGSSSFLVMGGVTIWFSSAFLMRASIGRRWWWFTREGFNRDREKEREERITFYMYIFRIFLHTSARAHTKKKKKKKYKNIDKKYKKVPWWDDCKCCLYSSHSLRPRGLAAPTGVLLSCAR